MLSAEELFKQDAFKKLEPEKLELIKSLQKEVEGKNVMEMVPIIMKYNAAFQQGKKLSKEDQNILLTTIRETLPDSDKQKFDMMAAMMAKGK